MPKATALQRFTDTTSCPLDFCHGICMRPPFSASWASTRPAASTHSAAV